MSDSDESDPGSASTPKVQLQFSSSDDVIAAISVQAELLSEKRAATRCGALGKLRDIFCAHYCFDELENWKESLCSSFSSCLKLGGEEEQLLVLRCATLFVITMAPEDEDLAERLEASFQKLKSAVTPAVAANLMLFRCCVCWMHSDLRATTALMGEVPFFPVHILLRKLTFHRFYRTLLRRLKAPAATANVWLCCPLVGACSPPPSPSHRLPPLPLTPYAGFSLHSTLAVQSQLAPALQAVSGFASHCATKL
jgi:hypothetical protein